MRLGFLSLPEEERSLYVREAAARRNVSPVIIEKDLWVCWLLAVLFRSRFADSLVFKGGTSLSKVFGAIDRFSEDIDLSVSPKLLGLEEEVASRTQATKWMGEAEKACAVAVETQLAPHLEKVASDVLGKKPGGYFEFLVDPATKSPVLLFHYPTAEPPGFDYLKRVVKLEFGSLTDQEPADKHPVRPWIADTLPEAFPDWHCEVVALGIARTFWEKATILHAEFHRPLDKPTPDRFSRHYADTAALAGHPLVQAALRDAELREKVSHWKGMFFRSSWANYGEASSGTFRLVPPSARQPALRRDYEAMRDMFLWEPPPFDEVLSTLAHVEARINC